MTALKPSTAHSPSDTATGIEARCAATGMRMTEQRRVIARVLADSVDHPDVEELYRRCIQVDDKISISTVYRTVKLFEDAKERFASDPEKAKKLATYPIGKLPKDADPAEMAAWTVIGNVLLNVDEMFMKR